MFSARPSSTEGNQPGLRQLPSLSHQIPPELLELCLGAGAKQVCDFREGEAASICESSKSPSL